MTEGKTVHPKRPRRASRRALREPFGLWASSLVTIILMFSLGLSVFSVLHPDASSSIDLNFFGVVRLKGASGALVLSIAFLAAGILLIRQFKLQPVSYIMMTWRERLRETLVGSLYLEVLLCAIAVGLALVVVVIRSFHSA